jgi:hypothetical protein
MIDFHLSSWIQTSFVHFDLVLINELFITSLPSLPAFAFFEEREFDFNILSVLDLFLELFFNPIILLGKAKSQFNSNSKRDKQEIAGNSKLVDSQSSQETTFNCFSCGTRPGSG